ncbi:alpha/beta hydrolase [Leifsonia sp. 22587]|uniref:alpha/beta hydrolase n=1 Tax=Leifsonia sp. 22587 TaxID=3453946 RepID=UPI003F858D49
MTELRQVDAGDLNVGYTDSGPADGPVALLLHGWPYDLHSFDAVVPQLVDAGFRVVVPSLRGYGTTTFRDPSASRNAQQAVFALDAVALLDGLSVRSAVVGGFDWGARTANILAALWPDRCRAQVTASGYLIGSRAVNAQPLPPAAELAWWYQFYFATERGRLGYDQNRVEFARLIWHTASPGWDFDDDTFARSAESFANPDHVDIVIHNYRWRLGLAEGDPAYDELEDRLAARPPIAVPAITLEGDRNGAAHPPASAYRSAFTGPYEHREVGGGAGHNLPQERPEVFAQAMIDAARMADERDAVAAGEVRHGG